MGGTEATWTEHQPLQHCGSLSLLLYTRSSGDGAEVTVHVDWHSPLRPGALWPFKGCQEGSHSIDTLPWASQLQEYKGQEAENFGRALFRFTSGQLGPLHSHQKYYPRDTKSGSANLMAQALRPLG